MYGEIGDSCRYLWVSVRCCWLPDCWTSSTFTWFLCSNARTNTVYAGCLEQEEELSLHRFLPRTFCFPLWLCCLRGYALNWPGCPCPAFSGLISLIQLSMGICPWCYLYSCRWWPRFIRISVSRVSCLLSAFVWWVRPGSRYGRGWDCCSCSMYLPWYWWYWHFILIVSLILCWIPNRGIVRRIF